MTMEAWITLAVLLVVLYFLVQSKRAPDAILWCGLAVLLIAPVKRGGGWELGVLPANEALSGLANEGVVTIAAMFAVAAGLISHPSIVAAGVAENIVKHNHYCN